MRYKSKVTIVYALQWDGSNKEEIKRFINKKLPGKLYLTNWVVKYPDNSVDILTNKKFTESYEEFKLYLNMRGKE